jgi:peptidyl-prolyl cis-trans isomerase D
MLQNIRDRLTGPLVWFIVGIIVIPFAFFGIETFRGGGGDPTIAKVGDQKIKESQFRRGYDQRLQQLRALMGEGFREDLIDQNRFRQTVLNDMVQESLLRQHVSKAGYRASNAMVFEELEKIPQFQEEGKFSSEAYKRVVAAQGYAVATFEQQLRDAIVVDQMREGILGTAFAAPAEAAQSSSAGWPTPPSRSRATCRRCRSATPRCRSATSSRRHSSCRPNGCAWATSSSRSTACRRRRRPRPRC